MLTKNNNIQKSNSTPGKSAQFSQKTPKSLPKALEEENHENSENGAFSKQSSSSEEEKHMDDSQPGRYLSSTSMNMIMIKKASGSDITLPAKDPKMSEKIKRKSLCIKISDNIPPQDLLSDLGMVHRFKEESQTQRERRTSPGDKSPNWDKNMSLDYIFRKKRDKVSDLTSNVDREDGIPEEFYQVRNMFRKIQKSNNRADEGESEASKSFQQSSGSGEGLSLGAEGQEALKTQFGVTEGEGAEEVENGLEEADMSQEVFEDGDGNIKIILNSSKKRKNEILGSEGKVEDLFFKTEKGAEIEQIGSQGATSQVSASNVAIRSRNNSENRGVESEESEVISTLKKEVQRPRPEQGIVQNQDIQETIPPEGKIRQNSQNRQIEESRFQGRFWTSFELQQHHPPQDHPVIDLQRLDRQPSVRNRAADLKLEIEKFREMRRKADLELKQRHRLSQIRRFGQLKRPKGAKKAVDKIVELIKLNQQKNKSKRRRGGLLGPRHPKQRSFDLSSRLKLVDIEVEEMVENQDLRVQRVSLLDQVYTESKFNETEGVECYENAQNGPNLLKSENGEKFDFKRSEDGRVIRKDKSGELEPQGANEDDEKDPKIQKSSKKISAEKVPKIEKRSKSLLPMRAIVKKSTKNTPKASQDGLQRPELIIDPNEVSLVPAHQNNPKRSYHTSSDSINGPGKVLRLHSSREFDRNRPKPKNFSEPKTDQKRSPNHSARSSAASNRLPAPKNSMETKRIRQKSQKSRRNKNRQDRRFNRALTSFNRSWNRLDPKDSLRVSMVNFERKNKKKSRSNRKKAKTGYLGFRARINDSGRRRRKRLRSRSQVTEFRIQNRFSTQISSQNGQKRRYLSQAHIDVTSSLEPVKELLIEDSDRPSHAQNQKFAANHSNLYKKLEKRLSRKQPKNRQKTKQKATIGSLEPSFQLESSIFQNNFSLDDGTEAEENLGYRKKEVNKYIQNYRILQRRRLRKLPKMLRLDRIKNVYKNTSLRDVINNQNFVIKRLKAMDTKRVRKAVGASKRQRGVVGEDGGVVGAGRRRGLKIDLRGSIQSLGPDDEIDLMLKLKYKSSSTPDLH